METKRCFRCGEQKPRSEFYRHPQMADGLLGKCKQCTKVDVRNNYAARRPQYSRYGQQRMQQPDRRAKVRQYSATSRRRNPEKVAARRAVSNAVRDGRMARQPCAWCGTNENVEAHHSDYSRPLDVVWECFRCHREREHGQVVTVATWPGRS